MVLENGIFFWSHAVENAEHLRLQSCFRPRDVMIDVIIDAKMHTHGLCDAHEQDLVHGDGDAPEHVYERHASIVVLHTVAN